MSPMKHTKIRIIGKSHQFSQLECPSFCTVCLLNSFWETLDKKIELQIHQRICHVVAWELQWWCLQHAGTAAAASAAAAVAADIIDS